VRNSGSDRSRKKNKQTNNKKERKEATPTGLYNDGHNWPMHMLHHSGIEKAHFNAVNVSFGTKGLIRMQVCV